MDVLADIYAWVADNKWWLVVVIPIAIPIIILKILNR